jgi:hypothetical protein
MVKLLEGEEVLKQRKCYISNSFSQWKLPVWWGKIKLTNKRIILEQPRGFYNRKVMIFLYSGMSIFCFTLVILYLSMPAFFSNLFRGLDSSLILIFFFVLLTLLAIISRLKSRKIYLDRSGTNINFKPLEVGIKSTGVAELNSNNGVFYVMPYMSFWTYPKTEQVQEWTRSFFQ